MPELVAGRFRIQRALASGGMGQVYEALDTQVADRRVALKVQRDNDPDTARRFAREAEILSTLRHPVAVGCHAAGQLNDGRAWLSLEWLSGEDLHARLQRGPVPPAEALALVARVADALDALHALGVIHRDIKPENLFLEGGALDSVRLLDLGIARFIDPIAHGPRTGAVIGTPAYMSPEQVRASDALDHRSDLWSLGVVLYECLTGVAAWPGSNPLAVMVKVLLEPPPRLSARRPDLPASLDALVASLLMHDPAARPERAADVAAAARDLAAACRDLGLEEAPPALAAQHSELGVDELRYLTVLLVGGMGGAPTMDGDETHQWYARLDEAAVTLGAVPQSLADGTLLVTFPSGDTAMDRAARAARLAIALHELAPHVPYALATGASRSGHGAPALGAVVDAAAEVLERFAEAGGGSGVHVDEHTAGLLPSAFVLSPPDADALHGARWLLGRVDAGAAARPVLGRPTPFIGRDRELRLLEGFRREAERSRQARLVVVEGEPGMGKSRLRDEWLARVLTVAPTTRLALSTGVERGCPWSGVAGLVTSVISPQSGRTTGLDALLGAETSATLFPFLARVVGLEPGTEGVATTARFEAARSAPSELEVLTRNALATLVEARAQRTPLVIVVDDAQWLDASSRGWLTRFTSGVRASPVLCVLFERPQRGEGVPPTPAHAVSLPLPPLPTEAMVQIASAILDAPTVPPQLVVRAEGNPYYLEELLRTLTQTGGGRSLPTTILAMVQSRFDRLTTAEKRVLRGASLIGRQFSTHGLRAMLGEMARHDLQAALDGLRRAEFVSDTGSHWHFVSDLVRDAASETWTPEDRPMAHARAARWLGVQPAPDALEVAEHWSSAGEVAQAAPWWARAAEKRLESNDLVGACRVAERALAALGGGVISDSAAQGSLLATMGHALCWMGQSAQGAARLAAALAHLEVGTAAWFRAAADMLSAHRVPEVEGQPWAAALEGYARAADSAGARGAAATALCRAATLAWDDARDAEGDALFATAVEMSEIEPLPSPADAHIARTRAARAWRRGDFGDCIEALVVALDGFRAAGLTRHASGVRGNLGAVCVEVGLYERACSELSETAREASSLGLVRLEASAWHNLGHALLRLGRLDEALEVEEMALRFFEAHGDDVWSAATRLYLARIHTAGGRPAQGLSEVARALPVLEARAASMQALALAAEAEAQLALGHADAALAATRRGFAWLDSHGSAGEGELLLRAVELDALAALGRLDDWPARAEWAAHALNRRADNLRNPGLRAAFLNDVAENAAIARACTRSTEAHR